MRRYLPGLLVALLAVLLLLAGLRPLATIRLELRPDGERRTLALESGLPAATCTKEFGASFPFVTLRCVPREQPPARLDRP